MIHYPSRELVRTAIDHERVPRIPFYDSFWDETLAAWRQQGFPAEVAPEEFFGFDLTFMHLDCSPRFPQKIVASDAKGMTFQDRYGYTAYCAHGAPTLHFRDHPTRSREAWEAIRAQWVFDPAAPEARLDEKSYFKHFTPYPTWETVKARFQEIQGRGRFLLFGNYGPWEAAWRHRGFESLLMDLALDPDWVADMVATHHRVVMATLRHCLQLGIKPDGYFIVDDLASNKGLLFSPDTWRQVFKPRYAELGQFLRDHGITFFIHCCGNPESLLDDLIDCGIQVVQPLQVSAGMDLARLQARYGRALTFFGGISAQAMAGPREALETELRTKLALFPRGGYIYHSDHSVPSDVPYENYRWLVRYVKNHAP
jgi:uroporphyrinogen decarboxylase